MRHIRDTERERKRFEQECAQARERNKLRHRQQSFINKFPELVEEASEDPVRIHVAKYVQLKRGEVATLFMNKGRVTIVRQIWPPMLYRQAWCQYGQVGQVIRVKEPVAYFGRDACNALYCYTNVAEWDSLDTLAAWRKLPARDMPLSATRFWARVISTERSSAKQEWTIELAVIDFANVAAASAAVCEGRAQGIDCLKDHDKNRP